MTATPVQSNAKVGDVRSNWLLPFLFVLSIITFVSVLYLTAYKTFFVDEWVFVATRREWTWDIFMLSHNGHWSTIPILVWKLLFVLVGIKSHLPYEAAALVVHVAAVLLLFALVRRRAGDVLAFGAALMLLVLGRGADNIVWAFQIAWLGSIAFGLLAMLLLEGDPPFPSRVAPVAAALLCSLMCSSVGIVFLVAVGTELALDRGRRRFLLALVVPTVVFIAWFVALDTGSIHSAPGIAGQAFQGPTGMAYIASLAAFVIYGLEACAAGVFGFSRDTGLAIFPAAGALIAFAWYRRGRVESWQIGSVVGLLAWFALVSVGRSQFGASYASSGRYLYVGAAFLLPLLASALRDLPWRGLYRPVLVTAFAICLFVSASELRNSALNQTDLMMNQAAELRTTEVFRGGPDMAVNNQIDERIMPSLIPAQYFPAIDELGSPVPPATVDTLRSLPPWAVDRVMVTLFGPALRATPTASRSTDGLPCRQVDSRIGATMDLQVQNAESIMLQATQGGRATLYLGYLNPPEPSPVQDVQLGPATPSWVRLPDTGKPILWQLRITTAPMGMVQVCGNGTLQVQEGAGTIYRAEARTGTLGPGWSTVRDSGASGGLAAKAPAGNYSSYRNDVFLRPLIPAPGPYDVWYRVRVAGTSGTTPEMTLGLWDDQKATWVGSTKYAPAQLRTSYSWVKVAASVTPVPGHSVQFIASFEGHLGTDWYVDEAVMVPMGSSEPAA
ncbi:MAG TPA: hypothetical protein VFH00_08790 [Candidatus Nitrosotalea sp.]|nr:hypothetical protein [Candidatus Nitrosotalea sp.]